MIAQIFNHFPDAFQTKSVNPDKAYSNLKSYVDKFATKTFEVNRNEKMETSVSGKNFSIKCNKLLDKMGLPRTMLPLVITCTQAQRPKSSMTKLRLDFNGDKCMCSWTEDGYSNNIPVALDGSLAEGKMRSGGYEYKTLANGYWTDKNTFELAVYPIETLSKRTIRLKFKENGKIEAGFMSYLSFLDFAMGHKDEDMTKLPKTLYNLENEIVTRVVSHYEKQISKGKMINNNRFLSD